MTDMRQQESSRWWCKLSLLGALCLPAQAFLQLPLPNRAADVAVVRTSTVRRELARDPGLFRFRAQTSGPRFLLEEEEEGVLDEEEDEEVSYRILCGYCSTPIACLDELPVSSLIRRRTHGWSISRTTSQRCSQSVHRRVGKGSTSSCPTASQSTQGASWGTCAATGRSGSTGTSVLLPHHRSC